MKMFQIWNTYNLQKRDVQEKRTKRENFRSTTNYMETILGTLNLKHKILKPKRRKINPLQKDFYNMRYEL
jgi:hypothetical protein